MLRLKQCIRDIANWCKQFDDKNTPVVLYTNPNPTAAFSATILNIDWEKYSFIGVVFPETGELRYPTNTSITSFGAKTVGGLGSSGGYTWVGSRYVQFQAKGIYISAMSTKYANSTTLGTSTGSLIPLIIYGYK